MTDTPPAAAQGGPNIGQMMRNIGGSLIVSALLPYLAYRFLEPHFAKDSVYPLLYSTIFPVLGFAWGVFRRRAVDAIALIVMAEIAASIAATLLSANVGWALIARASQGTITGLVFAFTALIGKPIVYYFARQFVAGSGPERTAGFDMAHVLDKGRTFKIATYVWAVALILISFVSITMAAYLPHATYVGVSPVLSVGANILLVWWTIRFSSTRLLRYRPQAA